MPKINGFLYENHWAGPTLTLVNVLDVLNVLNMLNVMNVLYIYAQGRIIGLLGLIIFSSSFFFSLDSSYFS